AGIPRWQIAAVGEADSDAKKQALFERVRQGTVRVLIGSTAKMGTGANVQRRLCALHHLDAPWKPAEVEQREGRILRQGNENQADEQFLARRNVRESPATISHLETRLAALTADQATARAHAEDPVIIDGVACPKERLLSALGGCLVALPDEVKETRRFVLGRV